MDDRLAEARTAGAEILGPCSNAIPSSDELAPFDSRHGASAANLNECLQLESEVEAGAILTSQPEQVHAEAAPTLAETCAVRRRGDAALEMARRLAASAEELQGRLAGLIAQAGMQDEAGGNGEGQLSR
jgi:hypothetical protein